MALLTGDGCLRLLRSGAAGEPIDLSGLDAAERGVRLVQALRQADVALLCQDRQYSEILWEDEGAGALAAS